MVREIRWSVKADRDRFEILTYWINRNKSTTFSIKLNKLFIESVEHVAKIPESGKPTDHNNIRIKIVRDYLIYYRIQTEYIEVLTVWDSRRNPKKFKLL